MRIRQKFLNFPILGHDFCWLFFDLSGKNPTRRSPYLSTKTFLEKSCYMYITKHMRKVYIFLILLALLLTWLQWPVIMSPRPRDLGGRLMLPLIPSQHLSSAARWKSRGGELLTCDIYCKHYISSLEESLCLNLSISFATRTSVIVSHVTQHLYSPTHLVLCPVCFSSGARTIMSWPCLRPDTWYLPHQMINSFIFGPSNGQTPKWCSWRRWF